MKGISMNKEKSLKFKTSELVLQLLEKWFLVGKGRSNIIKLLEDDKDLYHKLKKIVSLLDEREPFRHKRELLQNIYRINGVIFLGLIISGVLIEKGLHEKRGYPFLINTDDGENLSYKIIDLESFINSVLTLVGDIEPLDEIETSLEILVINPIDEYKSFKSSSFIINGGCVNTIENRLNSGFTIGADIDKFYKKNFPFILTEMFTRKEFRSLIKLIFKTITFTLTRRDKLKIFNDLVINKFLELGKGVDLVGINLTLIDEYNNNIYLHHFDIAIPGPLPESVAKDNCELVKKELFTLFTNFTEVYI